MQPEPHQTLPKFFVGKCHELPRGAGYRRLGVTFDFEALHALTVSALQQHRLGAEGPAGSSQWEAPKGWQ